jgi:hypothetical protein
LLLLHCLAQWQHLVLWVLVPRVTVDTDHSQSSGANGLVFQVEGLAMSVVLFAKIKQNIINALLSWPCKWHIFL